MKEQTELSKIVWKEDPRVGPSGEAEEKLKIQENNPLNGLLWDIRQYEKMDGKTQNVYVFKVKDDPVLKLVYGTTMLDRQMSKHKVGDLVRIERLPDKPTNKGNPMQEYKTYSAQNQ